MKSFPKITLQSVSITHNVKLLSFFAKNKIPKSNDRHTVNERLKSFIFISEDGRGFFRLSQQLIAASTL